MTQTAAARAKMSADTSRILSTSTTAKASRWDELLRLQVDLLLPQELDFYFGLPAWREARDVLDAGCGNGYYLSRLQNFFPEKRFTGIDISQELIEVASRRQQDGLAFVKGDFFTLEGSGLHDAVVMRFIVQHLKDFPALLAQASRILRPGGSLVIIEPDLQHSANYPSIPCFDELLVRYHESAASESRMRGQLEELPGLAAATPGWSVEADARLVSPRIGPFAGTGLQRMYLRWVDLIEQSRMLTYNFDLARHAVEEWSERSATFSQITLRVLSLNFKPSE